MLRSTRVIVRPGHSRGSSTSSGMNSPATSGVGGRSSAAIRSQRFSDRYTVTRWPPIVACRRPPRGRNSIAATVGSDGTCSSAAVAASRSVADGPTRNPSSPISIHTGATIACRWPGGTATPSTTIGTCAITVSSVATSSRTASSGRWPMRRSALAPLPMTNVGRVRPNRAPPRVRSVQPWRAWMPDAPIMIRAVSPGTSS